MEEETFFDYDIESAAGGTRWAQWQYERHHVIEQYNLQAYSLWSYEQCHEGTTLATASSIGIPTLAAFERQTVLGMYALTSMYCVKAFVATYYSRNRPRYEKSSRFDVVETLKSKQRTFGYAREIHTAMAAKPLAASCALPACIYQLHPQCSTCYPGQLAYHHRSIAAQPIGENVHLSRLVHPVEELDEELHVSVIHGGLE